MDFQFANHGSVCLLRPVSDAAKMWAAENINDAAMEFGGAIVIEPRYVGPIIDGIASDGLEVAQWVAQ